MPAALVDPQVVAQVAARYSLPPAILLAVAQQRGGDVLATSSVTAAYGLTPQDVQDQPDLQLEMVARQLSQAYSAYGDWKQALSYALFGTADAADSPTSPAGGTVEAILGTAAADPTQGMEGFVPANPGAFSNAAAGFTKQMREYASTGGVVTHDSVASWHDAVYGAVQRSGAVYGSAGKDPYGRAIFNPQYDVVAQGFMPGPGSLEPNHPGIDYSVPDHTPLYAPVAGTVTVDTNWTMPGHPQGWAVMLHGDDGRTYILGHVSQFTVHSGQRVGPGDQLALSGGASGEAGAGFSTGAHLHFEIRDAQGQPLDPSQFVQTAEAAGLPQAAAQPPQKVDPVIATMQAEMAQVRQEQGVAPADVGAFADQLRSAGIDPAHFAQHYPYAAAMRRRLLQQNTSVDDYAPLAGMDPAQMRDHLRGQPHSVYPEITAGQFSDMHGMASLHAVSLGLGYTPEPSEVARLVSANADWNDVRDYYAQMAKPMHVVGERQPQQERGARLS